MTIKQLINESHRVAKSKGWWDTERNDAELIALMHSELSEALEAMRGESSEDVAKDTVAEELADCCIRIFDFCGARNIDLQSAIINKIEHNRGRPYRHGKKF